VSDSDVDDRRVYAAWAVPMFGFLGIVAGALPTPSAPL
jgi:hypothetical protein